MPTPAKPCIGQFSEETLAVLARNTDRAQWHPQPCALCGQDIGARLEKGKWIPEQHWPSVQYKERTRRIEKRVSVIGQNTAPSPS
jgi:hypothetical protein